MTSAALSPVSQPTSSAVRFTGAVVFRVSLPWLDNGASTRFEVAHPAGGTTRAGASVPPAPVAHAVTMPGGVPSVAVSCSRAAEAPTGTPAWPAMVSST